MAHRYPTVLFLPDQQRRTRAGHPWAYSNEIRWEPQIKALPPGSIVRLCDAAGDGVGLAFFNPQPLVSARLLTRDMEAEIDAGWLRARLAAAIALRRTLGFDPYCRLVHGESDGLPGLVVDRYGDVVVMQLNSAGMDRLRDMLLAVIDELLSPRAIILRNDTSGRALEGLPQSNEIVTGTLDGPVELVENGVTYLADLMDGQKTGWFYDQRRTRAAIQPLAAGARVVDLFSHSGAFGIMAAMHGAKSTLLVDRSAMALDLATRTAARNAVADSVTIAEDDALGKAEALLGDGRRFDLVIADPPAFVKAKKDLAIGLKTYRKTARLAAGLVAQNGFLLLCSCSHNVDADAFLASVTGGLTRARRNGRILRLGGAAEDHPVHPYLPESAYLKTALLQLD